MRSGNCIKNIKRRPAKQEICLVGKKRITQETQKKKEKVE